MSMLQKIMCTHTYTQEEEGEEWRERKVGEEGAW